MGRRSEPDHGRRCGGNPLVSVPGPQTRPTTDRVKEALFSRLDVFDVLAVRAFWTSTPVPVHWAWRAPAGVPQTVDLVEFDAKASGVCQRNADLINPVLGRKAVTVHRSGWSHSWSGPPKTIQWDVVFLDPPYPLDEPALAAVLAKLRPHLAAGAVVVVERSSRSPNRPGPQPWNGSQTRSMARPGCGSPNRPVTRK